MSFHCRVEPCGVEWRTGQHLRERASGELPPVPVAPRRFVVGVESFETSSADEMRSTCRASNAARMSNNSRTRTDSSSIISLMCRAGYRPEWVAERVGHSDGGALVLKRYRHLYPSESYAAAPSLDALVAEGERR
jgi:hypothetical protein